MLAKVFFAAWAVLFFATFSSGQGGPEGHWQGTLKADNREIGLSLDLARNAKSEWIASMGLPSEKMTGLVVADVKADGQSVKFTAVELRMAKVDLTMESQGTLKGTILNPRGEAVPIEFRRTGEARVELIPASPAVLKELEGDWEGGIQMPGRVARMILHFKNQPDKTVAATVDTPDTGGFGLPLNDVKQSGRNVEFGLKIAHASFKGTLNPEGTELAGQFRHEENSAPLTFKKKW